MRIRIVSAAPVGQFSVQLVPETDAEVHQLRYLKEKCIEVGVENYFMDTSLLEIPARLIEKD